MDFRSLLLGIPAGLALDWFNAPAMLVFAASALAVIPLAQMMGDITEDLALSLGPAKGGLLNASMGTVPDIIIGFFALQNGLTEMVKASITGALVGNLLFGLGASILVGGLTTRQALGYDQKTSHLYSGLLLLATFGLIIPAVFDHSVAAETEISLEISVVLFLSYLVSALFTLTNQPDQTEYPMIRREPAHETRNPDRRRKAVQIGKLAVITVFLAIMSEIMADVIDPAAKSVGFSPLFAGIFLLAPVGMAAELINSIRFARQNQLDLSLAITMGSSTQVALLAAPLLVFFGVAMHQPMNLLFSKFEVIAIIMSVVAVNNILNLDTVRWVSGPKLLAVYIMLGFGFYYAS